MMSRIATPTRIKLPPLHKNQETIFSDNHRFRVVAAGRRFGKSKVALAECVERAVNKGQIVWWLSPSYSVSDKQWRETKGLLEGIYTDKSEQQRRMEFYYADGRRGELYFRSADRFNNLRGEGLDFVVIDEAAFVHPDVWQTIVRPMLVDRIGSALFISTPNGLNWFYKIYQRGDKLVSGDKSPDWQSFHFTSYDNLAIRGVKAEVDAAKEDMSDLQFRQEHLAEFVTDAGSLFRNIEAMAVMPMLKGREEGHLYTAGIDWGRKHDATVINVIDITDMKQVYLDRFTKTGWELQKSRVKYMNDIFHPVKIHAEANAAGQPIIEALINDGMKNLVPFYTSGTSKAPVVDAVALAIERGELFLLDEDDEGNGSVQANELRAYSMWQTKNGIWQYGAPPGFMDDTVIALALAYHGVTIKPSKMEAVANPFYGSPFGRKTEPVRRGFFERKVSRG
jgi:hypothetical protein